MKKEQSTPINTPLKESESAKVIFSPYLTEKDRRALERLKKHPIPKEFLKKS
jgi:hypothetical protein